MQQLTTMKQTSKNSNFHIPPFIYPVGTSIVVNEFFSYLGDNTFVFEWFDGINCCKFSFTATR